MMAHLAGQAGIEHARQRLRAIMMGRKDAAAQWQAGEAGAEAREARETDTAAREAGRGVECGGGASGGGQRQRRGVRRG
jgi:hypothetical protein